MKKYILLSLVVLAVFTSYGQKENNVWCFGYHAGLDFNSGSPVILTNTAISTMEGCSSIADANGQLLFYTDGQTVWNKNHVAMPNGTGLNGGGSSTQSAVIVEAPGSTTLYYVFTTAESQGANGFQYSTVDMTLQGGLGNVVSKNIPVLSNNSEKICGVHHSNGTDVWIMVHPLNSNGFYAYLLTSAGLNLTPVISNTGTTIGTGSGDEIGYMKSSPDCKKIAIAVRYQYYYELFDFNNATGVVSKPIHFSSGGNRTYGVEFSPDNSKLYFTGDNYLWQADLSSGDSALITASVKVISTSVEWAIQLAPDGKIYIAMYSTYLSVINNPNASGLACGFALNAINLVSVSSNLGLPNSIPTFTGSSIPPPVAALQSSDSSLCANDCISFTDLSTNNPTSWLWTFQGGIPSNSTLQNPPFVCYFTPGTYAVSLTASNGGGSNTITLNNMINVLDVPPTPTITQLDTLLYCNSNSNYISYQWYDDTTLIANATDTFLVVGHSGNYNLQVKNENGCSVAVGINIILLGMSNQVSGDHSITIYPNPAGEGFAVYGLQFTVSKVKIYSVLGEEASPPTPLLRRGESAEIDISRLPKGIYFVEMIGEKEKWIGKFVKQ